MTRKNDDTRYLLQRGGTWYLRIKVNGKPMVQTLRTGSLEKARQLRDERIPELTARMDEKARLKSIQRQLAGIEQEERMELESPLRGPLMVDAFAIFEKDPDRRHCSKVQMAAHRRHWRDFMAWMLKHHPEVQYCRQVTREICREWAAEKLADSRATNTYNRHISTVRYVFTALNGVDEQIKNPMERIHKRVDVDCVSKEIFTEEELQAIFKSPEKEFCLLSAIGLYTTLRLGRARTLTWEMIDPDLSYIHANHGKPRADGKPGAEATQKICDELREWLETIPLEKRHGYVCPRFAARTKANACCIVKDCLQRCGIQTQRQINGLNGQIRTACVKGFHSFRHTGITLALQHGATVAQVKKLAGHASERMQERYTHLSADDAGAASAKIGKFW